MMKHFSCGSLLAGAIASTCTCMAQATPSSPSELKQLSLEELMDLEVTSVSRTGETLEEAAAAIAVVSNEDIRRSGATSLPEALRFVPGLHVARNTASSWAIASRGFSSVNSEKLLVLSDTRSIYTPLYSGVFWDVQDYLLQDVERIEVIRGPGAALWGSNAVNGVINVTTKSARDTQGLYFESGAGTEMRASGAARYGGRFAEDGYFRVFGKYSDRDDSDAPGNAHSDDWHLAHGGFRAEWQASEADAFTVQGDVYQGTIGQLAPSVRVSGRQGPEDDLRVRVSGGNVLSRWRRSLDDGELQLRFYYDRSRRDDPTFIDSLDTFDLDMQHQFALPGQHIVWGANYRYTDNENRGRQIFTLQPPSSRDQVISAFVQDQLSLTETLRLTLGTKLEHNDFSGFEAQPSVRMTWDPMSAHTLWGAVSRAARVPTRIERDLAIDVTNPAGNPVLRLMGNDDFDAETLIAYELGYRWRGPNTMVVDVAAFHNRYDDLASLEFGTPFIDATGRTIVPIINRNLTDGNAEGIELLAQYSPLPQWRLSASYSYLTLHLDAHGLDLNRAEGREGSTPRHQFGLRSYLDLPAGLQLDVHFRRIGAIESLPEIALDGGIDDYSELDLRLAWRLQQIEVAVVAQNLLHERHVEFGAPGARGEMERSVYGKVTWGF